ncbi:MAG: sialidase family protein [Polyangiales bacterium]
MPSSHSHLFFVLGVTVSACADRSPELAQHTAAAAASATDTQANNPQVQGSATSNESALFPTNKQNEPTIAVNPVAPSRLIAGANDEQRQPPCGPGPVRGASAAPSDCSFFPNVGSSGIYTSSDGGRTWTNRGLLDDQASWRGLPIGARLVSDGDPVIVYGPRPDGRGGFSFARGARAYYVTLASYYANAGSYPADKAPEYLAVSYSDDDGATWSAPVLATTKDNPNDFNDKESAWVDADPASPYFGRLYVTWTEFRSAGNGNAPIDAVYSRDGGATFSAPNQLTPAQNNASRGGRQGSVVRTGHDGSVYAVWEEGDTQAIAISRDGGVRWSRPATIGAVVDLDDPIPGANFRMDSFPSLAVDRRSNDGPLYVAWATRTAAGGRVVVARSNDRGATWSAPQTVSTAAEGYAFYQSLDVAPNGRVDVAYQALVARDTTRFGLGNASIHAWYTRSTAAGWSMPVRVSGAPSDPAVSAQNNLGRQFWGDYNTLVSRDDRAWFITTDGRRGAGCAAVDAYQVAVYGTGVLRGDMADRIARRTGSDPYANEPATKPAPQLQCPAHFGDTDAVVAVITP